MRLIDADALIDHLRKDPLFCCVEQYGITGVIEAAPTIDAVTVVRCKDCKYRPIDTGTHQYGHELEFPNEYKCPCQCGDNWYSWMPDDEWFCANGERRADEQT